MGKAGDMDTEVLGFVLTQKCNFRCRHCCNESGPSGAAPMPVEEVQQHIQSAARSGRFCEIGVSGGEPFLFRTQLEQIITTAHACGLTASVTTNGFWAKSRERGVEVLGPLVQQGLVSVNLSISHFHLEFTTSAILRNAALAALDLGLRVRINVVRTADFTLDIAKDLLQPLTPRLEFVSMPCIPVGRAETSVAAADIPSEPGQVFGNCQPYFSKVAVTSEGDVFPCCSPGGFTEPLRLGNLRNNSLDRILERAEESTFIRILHDVGPAFFVPFIKDRLRRDLLAEYFTDQCHLCHVIMSDADMRRVAQDAVAQLEREMGDLQITLREVGGLPPAKRHTSEQ